MKVEAGHRGQETTAEGRLVTILSPLPGTKNPIRVRMAIDRISAPGTRRATSTGVSSRPASVNSTGGLRSEPMVMKVAWLGTTKPAPRSAMKTIRVATATISFPMLVPRSVRRKKPSMRLEARGADGGVERGLGAVALAAGCGGVISCIGVTSQASDCATTRKDDANSSLPDHWVGLP